MKSKRTQLVLIIATAIFLVALVINQIIWVFQAADIQEKQFNHDVDMALSGIVEKISKDKKVCEQVGKCFKGNDSTTLCSNHLKHAEWIRIDSIIKNELASYSMDLEYEFEITGKGCNSEKCPRTKNSYIQSMDVALKKAGIILYLQFPDKNRFLINQIGPVFISSILFIIFITISFILTYKYYRKEKDLSLRTRDFINNMIHEFKTPLANISFANNMINKNAGGSEEKLKRYSGIITDENKRLERNVEDLLLIASVENGNSGNQDELIDLKELLTEVTDSFCPQMEKDGVVINLNSEEGIKVRGNYNLFFNAIVNLIDNGIKYNEGAPIIDIHARKEGGKVMMEVKDNGIGIKPEHQDLVFEKFYRVPTGDQHDVKGFGLGLSYVKMILEQMGGAIKVKSSIGKGTSFLITLELK